MPFYDFRCECGHEFEYLVSISNKPKSVICPVSRETPPGACETDYTLTPQENPCGQEAKPFLLAMPFINDTSVRILDYPGSKRLKAGYVHSHVDPGVKKVSVGAGGILNPRTSDLHPAASWVQPEWKKRAQR